MLPGFSVWKKEPLTLADSEPEPDLSITRGDESDFQNVHPSTAELVIEVAISSHVLDRANASLYAEAGVKEYWIVLASTQQVEVYRRNENGRFLEISTVDNTAILDCPSIPDLRVPLAEIFG